jgi:hypothetical protein
LQPRSYKGVGSKKKRVVFFMKKQPGRPAGTPKKKRRL